MRLSNYIMLKTGIMVLVAKLYDKKGVGVILGLENLMIP